MNQDGRDRRQDRGRDDHGRDRHRGGRGDGADRGQRDDRGRTRSGSRGQGGPRRSYSSARPSERSRRSTLSRLVAFEGLRLVREEDSYANLVLPRLLREHRVSGRDAAFTTELFYGSLRAQGRLDAILAACIDRSLEKVEPALLDVLRLGAYQLLDMTVAPHAATSETVALARAEVGAGAASFANAVLRRVGEKDLPQWIEAVAPDRTTDPTGHLSVVHSHPRWVVRALSDALAGHGRDRAEIDALLEAQNRAPAVSLVMRPGLTDLDELIDHGASRGRLSVFAASWPSGDPGGMELVSQGRVAVQDEGSQLAALALALGADDLVLSDDAHWLDLCAGPGGKTALLGGLTVGHDADLLAVELQEHRRELVDRAVATLQEAGCEITTRTADGTAVGAEQPGRFSRVLADVPCSGLGALRRRPEARWRRTPGDVGHLGTTQRALLTSALDAAAPGGVVAYVTCSPHLAETRLIVADVLKGRDDVEHLDARDAVRAGVLPEAQADLDLGEGPAVQLWPHVHGTDAMYIHLLRRQPAPTEEGSSPA
ncbi:RsmB/NOP family class I SAM-dependent RNA methyltransferase [Brachybacterium saurashtrense]|uniref:rRNA small subunit methyltransferase B n=1 Tax=Brachybacterium saurashtrense TaxID=556288 RepID=A0A345YMI3_9MICO|nr:transcription antitermination factor NusB [Brachybacterium saurashtrense]AXK45135.1 rRNA small subunit methyltransferase B [Brachybacterium saurashtrense]RRR22112.1 rRNA small subunit methyltransferase B [Brachybacterium saurashtrense]